MKVPMSAYASDSLTPNHMGRGEGRRRTDGRDGGGFSMSLPPDAALPPSLAFSAYACANLPPYGGKKAVQMQNIGTRHMFAEAPLA